MVYENCTDENGDSNYNGVYSNYVSDDNNTGDSSNNNYKNKDTNNHIHTDANNNSRSSMYDNYMDDILYTNMVHQYGMIHPRLGRTKPSIDENSNNRHRRMYHYYIPP